MLTLFEFTILGLYLATLLAFLVAIQMLNPGKTVREALHPETVEAAELELEEPDSDEEVPFDPTKETFAMTENPMLRHRNTTSPEQQPAINLEDVD